MSGEIIQMSNSMSLIFETMDLAQASPATVSRCGMIYAEPASLGYEPLLISWYKYKGINPIRYTYLSRLNSLPEHLQGEQRTLIRALFDWLLPPCLLFVRKSVRELVPTSESCMACALMKLFQVLMATDDDNPIDPKFLKSWITVKQNRPLFLIKNRYYF